MATESLSLSSEETRGLQEDRIILGGHQNGKRKVSAALLSSPSSYGSQSSAGDAAAPAAQRARRPACTAGAAGARTALETGRGAAPGET
jgi:hypothetical protein